MRCEFQDALASRAAREPSRTLQLRIGINLGDLIIEDDGVVYGDGVNVAARLERLADPGSVCISGKVHEEVQGKLPMVFEYLGDQQVKNIPRPVRVFRCSMRAPAAPVDSGGEPLPLPDRSRSERAQVATTAFPCLRYLRRMVMAIELGGQTCRRLPWPFAQAVKVRIGWSGPIPQT
jgi:hypothetical protein